MANGKYARTEEIINQMKLTKNNVFMSKMQWDLVDPYLDIELKNGGSSTREKKYITFRDFKNRLAEGATQEDLKNSGISKHVLQFISNFCQGKITLSKDKFQEEYKSGKDLDTIAKENNISRGDIGFLRQLYDIRRTGSSYQNRKKTEVLMTDRQKEICYGSMLGDAKRQNTKFNSSMGFGHSGKQKEYLFWKFCELESISSKTSFKATESIDKRSGTKIISWRFYTNANSDIEEIINEFYKPGQVKEVSQKILDNMSALSIAVWFMDDGRTDFGHRFITKGGNYSPIAEFCTECFSHDSCLLMQKWFKDRWNISTRLRERRLKDKIGYRLIIDHDSVEDFFSLIKPYIIPSMMYKIDYNEYVKARNKVKVFNGK